MPEGVLDTYYSENTQEICCENFVDIEEEAIIRTTQQSRKEIRDCLVTFYEEERPHSVRTVPHHIIRFCFERQWLMTCRLRL